MSVFLSKMHHFIMFSPYISVIHYVFCDYDNKITLALVSVLQSYNFVL